MANCKMCNMNVPQTEFHVLLCCPVYRNLRIQFLGNIRWPTLQQFKNIMSTKSKSKLFNVTKYIMNAYQLRNEYLVSIDKLFLLYILVCLNVFTIICIMFAML